MLDILWLVPVIPFIGFLILTLTFGKLPQRLAGIVGAGSIGLSFLVALLAVQVSFPLILIRIRRHCGRGCP